MLITCWDIRIKRSQSGFKICSLDLEFSFAHTHKVLDGICHGSQNSCKRTKDFCCVVIQMHYEVAVDLWSNTIAME